MLVRALCRRGLQQRARPLFVRPVRGFAAYDGKIPSDMEQQTGRRLQELEAEQRGEVAFNRDPIVPPPEQGTKTNPILVPSAFEERVVGYEDPDVGQLVWFTLAKGPIHYVPDIDLYFKLYPVA
ncbi:hypothetical protein CTAYLR_010563 [Chrysophaeum taylorii]|uniref:Uncharacterized protein n=1 Tax=Chrysophaeum taylorii TaxID=2483200 RepID=A0AAD7UHW3_9STRA|nr:hypothetical protein CTAYLR_010563 [Chrysophaeum taylorii]